MKNTDFWLAWGALLIATEVALSGEISSASASADEQIAAVIKTTLDSVKDKSAQQQLVELQAAARLVREKCPENVLVAEQLAAATDTAGLSKALQASAEILSFRLVKEADLPEGFPTPTPVGEVRVKRYPAYRLARTSSQKDSGFFRLFAHITLNRIEMTAPVEMTYRSTAGAEPEQLDMAFIYGNTTLGKAGDKFGGVTVQDVPAMTTVAIGLKGENSPKKIAEMEARLEKWMAQRLPEFERAGKLRVLGYNSPQVSTDSRYFEVEVPIQPAQK